MDTGHYEQKGMKKRSFLLCCWKTTWLYKKPCVFGCRRGTMIYTIPCIFYLTRVGVRRILAPNHQNK